jgi:hypothetical protein
LKVQRCTCKEKYLVTSKADQFSRQESRKVCVEVSETS